MSEKKLSDTPEYLLRSLEPIKNGALNNSSPGAFRTIFTIFIISGILLSVVVITSWMVFNQSKNRIAKNNIQMIIRDTNKDLPENYIKAINVLKKSKNGLGNLKSGRLIGKYSLFLVLEHHRKEYLQKGKLAVERLEKVSEKERKRFKSLFMIALLLNEKRYYKATLETEKALTKFPSSHLHFWVLALARIETGNWDAALSSLNMAIELSKSKVIPYLLTYASLERRMGNFSISNKFLRKILKISPKHKAGNIELYFTNERKGELKKYSDDENIQIRANIFLYEGIKSKLSENKLKFCEKSLSLLFSPEAYLCKIDAILKGSGDSKDIPVFLEKIKKYPLYKIKIFRAIYHLKVEKVNELEKDLSDLKNCKYCKKAEINPIEIEIARLTNDRDKFMKLCTSPEGKRSFHSCFKGALINKENKMLKKLAVSKWKTEFSPIIWSFYKKHNLEFAFSGKKIDLSRLKPYEAAYLSKIYIAGYKYKDAIKLLKYGVKKSGGSILSKLFLAEGYYEIGRFTKSMEIIDKILVLNHIGSFSMFTTGELLIKLNKIPSAELIAKKMMAVYPEIWRTHLLFTQIYYKQKQYKKMEQELNQAKSLTIERAELLLTESKLIFWKGDYPKAYKFTEKAVRESFNNYWNLMPFARLSFRYKRKSYGKIYVDIANKYLKNKDYFNYSLILAHYLKTLDIHKDRDEKTKIINNLKSIKSMHPLALYELSLYEFKQNSKSKEAVIYAKQAVKLAPSVPEFRFFLAKLIFETDKKRCRSELEYLINNFGYTPLKIKVQELLKKIDGGI